MKTMKPHCVDCDVCRPHLTKRWRVGTRVVAERDLKRWPSNEGWKRYEGREGVIESVNVERLEPAHKGELRSEPFYVEYNIAGVWFLPHELRKV